MAVVENASGAVNASYLDFKLKRRRLKEILTESHQEQNGIESDLQSNVSSESGYSSANSSQLESQLDAITERDEKDANSNADTISEIDSSELDGKIVPINLQKNALFLPPPYKLKDDKGNVQFGVGYVSFHPCIPDGEEGEGGKETETSPTQNKFKMGLIPVVSPISGLMPFTEKGLSDFSMANKGLQPIFLTTMPGGFVMTQTGPVSAQNTSIFEGTEISCKLPKMPLESKTEGGGKKILTKENEEEFIQHYTNGTFVYHGHLPGLKRSHSETEHTNPLKEAPAGAPAMYDSTQPLVCGICNDKATGLHYGIITCEGCKGFFKRTVQNKRVYSCVGNGNCVINKAQRNRCQFCRFKKCLQAGMVLAAVREDRMPGGRNSGEVYNLYKVKYKKHKRGNPDGKILKQRVARITTTESNNIKIEPVRPGAQQRDTLHVPMYGKEAINAASSFHSFVSNSIASSKYSSYPHYSRLNSMDSQHSMSSSVVYSQNQFVEGSNRESRMPGELSPRERSHYFPQEVSPGRSHYSSQRLSTEGHAEGHQYLSEISSPLNSSFSSCRSLSYEEQHGLSGSRQDLNEQGFHNYEHTSHRERVDIDAPVSPGRWTGYGNIKESNVYERTSPLTGSETVDRNVLDNSISSLNGPTVSSMSQQNRVVNLDQNSNHMYDIYRKRRISANFDIDCQNTLKSERQYDGDMSGAKRFKKSEESEADILRNSRERSFSNERSPPSCRRDRTPSHRILQQMLQDGNFHAIPRSKASSYTHSNMLPATIPSSNSNKTQMDPENSPSQQYSSNRLQKYEMDSTRNGQTLKNIVDIERLLQCDKFLDISDLFSIDELFGNTKEGVTKTLCTLGDKIVGKLVDWMKRLPFYRDIPIEVHSESLSNKWNELILLITTAYKAVRGARISGITPEQLYHANMKQLKGHLERMFHKEVDNMELEKEVGQLMRIISNLMHGFLEMGLSREEYVCLQVILLLNQNGSSTNNSVNRIQDHYSATLDRYVSARYPNQPNRYAELLLWLPQIQTASALLIKSKMIYIPFILNH